MDEVQRRMNRLFEEYGYTGYPGPERRRTMGMSWPQVNMYDAGGDVIIRAQVPGMSEKEVQVTGNQEMLTIAGERKLEVPQGYSVHRQERGHIRFTRSFALPCRVDMEKCSAAIRNGVLTVTLPKSAEARPRQITVRAQ
jgi:HSP20 family protein